MIPAAQWLVGYQRNNLLNDTVAAVIVTMMLIPQSLAYALLAGLPAEMGLYASILPLLAYAAFGSSRTLSVGPVAVASLMTASAVGAVAAEGTVDYATAATTLALLGGIMLIALGFLKFGFVANFLSHSVVSGFITASGIIIALGQLGPLIGISLKGDTAPVLLIGFFDQLAEIHLVTLVIGAGAIGFLLFSRYYLTALLRRAGCGEHAACIMVRAAPILIMLVVIPLSALRDFESLGVPLVGHVPSGLPPFSAPNISWHLLEELALPALLIALIGFVESVSVGKTLGAKKRQKIDSNQELLGLGAANAAGEFDVGLRAVLFDLVQFDLARGRGVKEFLLGRNGTAKHQHGLIGFNPAGQPGFFFARQTFGTQIFPIIAGHIVHHFAQNLGELVLMATHAFEGFGFLRCSNNLILECRHFPR